MSFLGKLNFRGFLHLKQSRCFQSSRTLLENPHEPEYLELLKPQQPVYELLNIQLKGYDYTVLEHYGRYVHYIAQKMNINVVNGWAAPNQSLQVTTYKPRSTKAENVYSLKLYERTLQVKNIFATTTPLFFDMIQNSLPEGVKLNVISHTQEIEENLYIPDLELEELRRQLDDMKNPKKQQPNN